MRIAIVTGASSGIGEEFCRCLDSKGLDSIWLVARSKDRLEALAANLKTSSIIISADLTDFGSIRGLADSIDSEKPEISYLINCAGFGTFGNVSQQSLEEINGMISLNCTALIDITSVCLPYMAEGSTVIEVCSASAYLPLKELSVYAATKSMVHSFCDSLRAEVKDDPRRISVLEVSPGWVKTDFIPKSIEKFDVPEKVFKHTVEAEDVAETAFKDLARGRKVSICGRYNKFQVFMCKHFPGIAKNIWERSLVRR